MTSEDYRKIQSGEAYRVFYQECEDRLRVIRHLVAEGFDSCQQQELKNRCHTLKGGAGFFGLAEIAQIADRLEKLLSAESLNLNEDLCQQLQESVVALEKSYQAIPKPSAGDA